MTDPLLLRRASVAPGSVIDLAVHGGVLVAPSGLPADAAAVDLEGRPVLPGLADHHIHLHAVAAAMASVDCSPAALARSGGLAGALRAARRRQPTGWLRGIGYDVATTGAIDREHLDAFGVGPVRIQDRTGILWVLDSLALDEVLADLDREPPEGVEHRAGVPTGVLVRLDRWLQDRVPRRAVDLPAVGRHLASLGVTAVTDAGADNDAGTLAALAAARLPLRVMAMTRDADVGAVEGVVLGPVKIRLDDDRLPALDALTAHVASAHRAGRTVAVHCVTPVQVVLALTAGLRPGDRVEHASHVPPDLDPLLVAAGVTAVVQPGLVRTRGDRYLAQHDVQDHVALHRLASLRRAGVPVAGSSDAPYGSPDPWVSIAAAVDRRTSSGAPFGRRERLGPRAAVALHTGHLARPATPRRLARGEPADLVVLDDDWSSVADHPPIAVTALAGTPTHGRWPT